MNSDTKRGLEMKLFMEAELRKVAKLPPSELRIFVQPFLTPLVQIFEALQVIQNSFATWINDNWDQIQAFRAFLQTAAVKVGEAVVAADLAAQQFLATLQRLQLLADQGWTLPTFLSVQDLQRFAQVSDSHAAAHFITSHLENADPDLKQMEARLLEAALLRDFATVLPQCFRAIRREDYALAIPSLIGMLERSIQALQPPHLQANTNVLKTSRSGEPSHKTRKWIYSAPHFSPRLQPLQRPSGRNMTSTCPPPRNCPDPLSNMAASNHRTHG